MSLVFNMVGGGSGGGSGTYAFIIVTYPAGSICTASDGTTTLTAPDTSGSWVCNVPNAGTWTVSCTDGTDTASANVSITTEGQREEVALSYTVYIVQAGQLILTPSALTHVRTPTSSGGYVDFTADGNYYCLADFGPIDCTGKSEIIIDVGAGSTSYINASVMVPSIGLSDSAPSINQSSGAVSPYVAYAKMTGTSPNVTPGTYTIPLSYTGSKHIWLAFSGSSQGTMTMHISNFYVR